jgi:hypothetical protein
MADAGQITTWIGVVASAISAVVALVTVYLRSKTKEKLAAIENGSPEAARIVADAVTSFDLNTEKLTKEQTFLLVRDEIAARDKKHARAVRLFFGIAIILAAVSVALSWILRDPEASSFDATVRLQLLDGTPATKGTVTIYYGNTSRSEPVNANGEATIKGIPAEYRLSEATIRIESSVYEAIDPNADYQLGISSINVSVRPTDEYLAGKMDGYAVGRLRRALKDHYAVHGAYPDSLQALVSKFVSQELIDGVEQRVSYRTDADLGYALRYAGPDGELGTADDYAYTAASR